MSKDEGEEIDEDNEDNNDLEEEEVHQTSYLDTYHNNYEMDGNKFDFDDVLEEDDDNEESKFESEFWKQIPPNELYHVILGDVRDKLYNTREHSSQLLAKGTSDISEELIFTDVEQLLKPLELCYRLRDRPITDASLIDFLCQVSTFGLSLVRLDIRQESDRHTDVLDSITNHLRIGWSQDWSKEKRQEWLSHELRGKRLLFGPDLPQTKETADVLQTFHVLAELPSNSFGAYIISMATAPSHVFTVELLQQECHVKEPLRVVPLFENLQDHDAAPAAVACMFSIDWYMNMNNGKQEDTIGYSDSGKDVDQLTTAWQLYKAQEELMKVAKQYDVKLTMLRWDCWERRWPDSSCYLVSAAGNDSRIISRDNPRGTATLEHGMHPPVSPKPQWRALMDEMDIVANWPQKSIV
ncbi:hypothetical protein ZIOFF_058219 [Zingiber officinale]|uniref:phosphoenolpyruvate carboxylase n=1 Tax=Zingiber officinale TaxID=94328 RepID=A0A8J5F6V5_ZINOF|nr:hypothetical protein ZIOFF_058219 [Zingiber officinale]